MHCRQQKYLQKQGWTMKHQLCESISSGSGVCKLPRKQYVLKVDKMFNFKNVNDEKKYIQSCSDCRHSQGI